MTQSNRSTWNFTVYEPAYVAVQREGEGEGEGQSFLPYVIKLSESTIKKRVLGFMQDFNLACDLHAVVLSSCCENFVWAWTEFEWEVTPRQLHLTRVVALPAFDGHKNTCELLYPESGNTWWSCTKYFSFIIAVWNTWWASSSSSSSSSSLLLLWQMVWTQEYQLFVLCDLPGEGSL